MAATKGDNRLIEFRPEQVQQSYYTTLEPGATVTHTLLGPSGVAPYKVLCQTTQRATSRDPVHFSWDRSANDTSSNTIAIQFDTVSGGDLAGAEAQVLVYWNAHASGGIS